MISSANVGHNNKMLFVSLNFADVYRKTKTGTQHVTTVVEWVWFSPLFVCLSLYPDNISKTDAVRITKLDIQLFHD